MTLLLYRVALMATSMVSTVSFLMDQRGTKKERRDELTSKERQNVRRLDSERREKKDRA